MLDEIFKVNTTEVSKMICVLDTTEVLDEINVLITTEVTDEFKERCTAEVQWLCRLKVQCRMMEMIYGLDTTEVLDEVNKMDTAEVLKEVFVLSATEVLDGIKVKSAIEVQMVASTKEVLMDSHKLNEYTIPPEDMVKRMRCSTKGWEVRFHSRGLQDRVRRLEDWEVRDQFKGLAMKCKRLDAIEESVKDMDLNDVREKNIEGFQVS